MFKASHSSGFYIVLSYHVFSFENEFVPLRIYICRQQTVDFDGKLYIRLQLRNALFYTLRQQKMQGYGDVVLCVDHRFGPGCHVWMGWPPDYGCWSTWYIARSALWHMAP
ncbi:DUF4861 family protein [Hallella colorans]|uniref:DUF4861 family protein n=1 Tax=Hallella colorans TaxID=1703337 RepID=UPI003CD0D3BF